ncbi:MAG: HNH endonuclease [Dehalococcoidia bacterium]
MSLQRANVRIEERRGFFGALKEVRLWFSRADHLAVGREAWDAAQRAEAPVLLGEDGTRRLWAVGGAYYWAEDGMDAEAVALLAWDRERRQDARLDRLRKIRAAEEDADRARRERLPDDVRAAVWLRDEGRCVRCGSEQELQFDHVIPFARGGSNAVENIQVLCGPCNRAKGDSIV